MPLNNKVQLIGHLGADPETRRLNSGDSVCNLRIATTDRWRDKASGERKERTEWHTVVIFNDALAKVADQYLKKGSHVAIEGKLQTRTWEKDGQKHYTTEIVLQNFDGQLQMLDKKGDDDDRGGRRDDRDRGRDDRDRNYGSEKGRDGGRGGGGRTASRDMDDEIPFNMSWK